MNNFEILVGASNQEVMNVAVKSILRGHLWDKKNWSFKTGDLLKAVHYTYSKTDYAQCT
jgi:hypothetical protein